MNHNSEDTDANRLADAKIAIERLSAVQRRVQALVAKMVMPHISRFGSLFGRSSAIESAERDIRQFADALIALIRLTKEQQRSPDIAAIVGNLERSESLNEISTLMGLTVLGEYREQLNRRAQIMHLWKDEIQQQMHRVMSMVEFGNELNSLSQGIRDVLNHDTAAREDDIVRMILAIQNHKYDLFNEICEKLEQRIETEEQVREPGLSRHP